MKHKDFEDHKLHCVQRWVRFIIEGIYTHMLEDSEDKEWGGGGGEVKSDTCETPIHETNIENVNALTEDGYKVDGDRLPAP